MLDAALGREPGTSARVRAPAGGSTGPLQGALCPPPLQGALWAPF